MFKSKLLRSSYYSPDIIRDSMKDDAQEGAQKCVQKFGQKREGMRPLGRRRRERIILKRILKK